MNFTFWGIWSIGFVFGYLLFYSLRRTKDFGIELLSSAFGAVGSGTVVGFLGRTEGWLGPYGVGLLSGFLFYLVLALIAFALGKLDALTNAGVLLRRAVVGVPTLDDLNAIATGQMAAMSTPQTATAEVRAPRR